MIDPFERRTKIVATIGPASDDVATLRALVAAGMDMARLSLAHGPLEETLERIDRVRRAAEDEGRIVGVLADLPGPKVRAARFPDEGVYLNEGDTTELVGGDDDDATSDWQRIAIDRVEAVEQLRAGDRVALGDGGIVLTVERVETGTAFARVLTGGRVRGRPGVVLPPGRFAEPTPTPEDLRLLRSLCSAGVDAVAISFVRSAADVERVRAAAGDDPPMLVAKIETQEAVDAIDEVISVSDGVMVARGDLGIRCAMEDVPHYQKKIIRTGVAYGRPVITATQMLESMVRAPVPTRAEVSDVANAVFDGTSALMLSGETAIGRDPAGAVETMSRIAARAEREFNFEAWGRALGRQQIVESHGAPAPVRITAAISAAGWRAATDAEATALIACTNTGATARAISRFRPRIPIVAATPSLRTARQLSVAWGITPLVVDRQGSTDDIVWFAVQAAAKSGIVKEDDVVAVLVGSPDDPEPATDVLRLVRIR
ncbi:MAG TPA: pyruvate kinase [Actinomycetota bacterium]|nr:pyruvate kinase [Actinomycetota bacterium]